MSPRARSPIARRPGASAPPVDKGRDAPSAACVQTGSHGKPRGSPGEPVPAHSQSAAANQTLDVAAQSRAGELVVQHLRKQVDAIDRALVDLLDRRAEITREIGARKRDHGWPSFDGVREEAILQAVRARGTGVFPRQALERVWGELLSACRPRIAAPRIACLGPAGSWSHIVALERHGVRGRWVMCTRVDDVVERVVTREADVGVLPIWNSTTGDIVEAQAALAAHGDHLSVISTCEHAIQWCLARSDPRAPIERLYGHPQAFQQCARTLRARFAIEPEHLPTSSSSAAAARVAIPTWEPVPHAETLASDRERHIRTSAALTTPWAAALWGLTPVDDDLGDTTDNRTTFAWIERATPDRAIRGASHHR